MVNRFYFFLNLFGFVVYCCGSFVPETSRIGYYMIISQIFLLPRLIGEMENKVLRRAGGKGAWLRGAAGGESVSGGCGGRFWNLFCLFAERNVCGGYQASAL